MNKLHYPGDHRNFVRNRIIGPDMFGAWYLPVSAHYFNGVTTMFLKPVPPDKLPKQAAVVSQQILAENQAIAEIRDRIEGRKPQWLRDVESYRQTRSQDSSPESPTSPRSGGRSKKAARAGSGLTKSQRELLKRFKKPT